MLDEARLRERPPAVDPGALWPRVGAPLAEVERRIDTMLDAGDAFLYEASIHLLRGGGKRLRPALYLLSFEACGGDPSATPAVSVAASLECVHMATLVHDDVIDGADRRRGVPTVHSKWGTHTGVLVGDYLFARAFATLSELAGRRALRFMAGVVLEMARGEVAEQHQAFHFTQTLDGYYERIHQKTAAFVGECCRLAAVLREAGDEAEDALWRYGRALGMAFQVMDDILDFSASPDALGKPAGNDLRAGLLTLPALETLRHPDFGPRFRALIEETNWGERGIESLLAMVRKAGAIERSREVAGRFTEEARAALAALPASPARDVLDELAGTLLERGF